MASRFTNVLVSLYIDAEQEIRGGDLCGAGASARYENAGDDRTQRHDRISAGREIPPFHAKVNLMPFMKVQPVMNVTSVKLANTGELRVFAVIVLDDCLAIHGLRIIESEKALWQAVLERRSKTSLVLALRLAGRSLTATLGSRLASF